MRKVIKNNYKIIISFIIGLLFSLTTVYAVDAYIESNKVTYTNHNKTNVEEAIDELYERSGIHKEKWVDPILNGADPVLKAPLIPVTIDNDGNAYYANLNSEWYNYKEKRWANAIILIDNPSNSNYQVGDKIEEDDIESYFVWIPRYQYKIWNMANTDEYIDAKDSQTLNNDSYNTSPSHLFSNTRLIDIQFGNINRVPKMNESEASLNNYYTHPAFTLGSKDLNGIWVGKFETGYKGAKDVASAQVNREEKDSVIIKPDVYSWRTINTKKIFMTSYNYERGLDSHMIKNTEWGAVAYLSHSEYGLGNEININNAKDNKTGYSAAPNTDQSTMSKSDTGFSTDKTKTQPWNTTTGYLASTSGNITGVYDMSGGAREYVAAIIIGNRGSSEFSVDELNAQINAGYIDEYSADSSTTAYNKRILGDATGELGQFYKYFDGDGYRRNHNSWYGNLAIFAYSSYPWFHRGGTFVEGGIASQFNFNNTTGDAYNDLGFRIVLAI